MCSTSSFFLCDHFVLTTSSFIRQFFLSQSLLSYRTMEHRDYDYYEARAADIILGDITSSVENANNLQRLRHGDDTLSSFSLGGPFGDINISEDNDWGWWGYFIGRSECIQRLGIHYLPEREEGHAFVEGIARSQSIRDVSIHNLNNEAFTSIMRALHSLSQLEELYIGQNNNVDPDGWSELGFLLESGVCKLKELDLRENNYIRNQGLDVLSNGLRGIGSSLKKLVLDDNSIGIGNRGLFTADMYQTRNIIPLL